MVENTAPAVLHIWLEMPIALEAGSRWMRGNLEATFLREMVTRWASRNLPTAYTMMIMGPAAAEWNPGGLKVAIYSTRHIIENMTVPHMMCRWNSTVERSPKVSVIAPTTRAKFSTPAPVLLKAFAIANGIMAEMIPQVLKLIQPTCWTACATNDMYIQVLVMH